ncbi:MAG TPA: adenylate/guanylate cyclase domain-containing protein [Vicinamibacterales bacterium]|nr:adenylate/guanylate cyclase domain-containing protein [Vicinamibacterales bacterium]
MRGLWPSTPVSRLVASAALALAFTVLLALAQHVRLLATTQVAAGDLLFKTRGAEPARSTVIVGIDQQSYQALLPVHGPLSQWPRTLYARALDALMPPGSSTSGGAAEGGPRVIAFEIFFDGERPAEDATLAQAVRRVGNVVTPVVAQGAEDLDRVPGVAQQFEIFLRPSRLVREAAAGEGLANVAAARDSVVRGLPLLLHSGDETLPAMALTIAALYARRPTVLDGPPGAGVVYGGGRAIPVDEGDTMRINFLGPPSRRGRPGPFTILPFVDVLEGRFDRALVRDRIVLIGPTIRGVDEHPTPTTTYDRMWGVEILASAVETIVHQRFLVPASAGVTFALTALLALSAAALAMMWSPWAAAAGVVLALAAYFSLAALLFEAGTVLDLVSPPIAMLATFALTLAYRVVFVEAEQRFVRQAMGRYLSPAVGRWVLADPRRLSLGGETRAMTVLFSDVRNFTTLAHELPPNTLVTLLNRYRTAMTHVVFTHDGVLAQYVGDAIEAFWNAPMDQPDHARRACEAALDMVRALESLRAEFERLGWDDLDIGVGINTGAMVVGNMGSQERLAYTAVGDAVNVASRLEGLTKEYGVHVVIGDNTRAAAGDAFAYRFLDVVAVKGRPVPLVVWELLDRERALEPGAAARLARYHEGVDLYRAQQWHAAANHFADLEREAPGDGPVALYARRTREALDDPPPPNWDGVYVARTK